MAIEVAADEAADVAAVTTAATVASVPAVPSGPTSDGVVLAVDVGGTSIKGLVVDGDGGVRGAAQRATPQAAPHEVPAAVRAVVSELAAAATGESLRAVGVAVPGTVDPVAGVALYSANLGWRSVPAAELVGPAATAVPVVLDHDVRSAGVAERVLGAARDVDDSLVVVIGTGIAAVSVSSGRELRGARGMAGELGHVTVRPGGEACACSRAGCLEVYASAAALTRRYAAATGRAVAAQQVLAAVAHDPHAARVWHDAVDTLATALVDVTMVNDPAVIVLAGGLSEAGETLLGPVRAAVSERLTWRPAPRIERSRLGAHAGRYGIAVLAWQAAGVSRFGHWPSASGAAASS